MYTLEDLFDRRSPVGTRLEQILMEKKCTKAELSKKTGVSRPTIDKVLSGTITSKKNYETHMSKIMNYLQITPDSLLGNNACSSNRVREIRSIIRISTEKMASATGISQERLQQIEAGEKATITELREIAMQLRTSTHVITNQYFFEPQFSEMEYYMDMKDALDEISGFWGHVGIKLCGIDKYMWYPINSNTRKMIYKGIDEELMVIPCMNNKVLFLNINRRVRKELNEKEENRNEKVCFMNMCMVQDDKGNVLALDKVNDSYTGTTFPGGHVEQNEIFQKSIIREVWEETGLTIESPKLCGLYHWHEDGVHSVIMLYKAEKFIGELKSSEEGQVYWIPLEELKTRELATGMKYVLQILGADQVNECYMHLESEGYVGDLY